MFRLTLIITAVLLTTMSCPAQDIQQHTIRWYSSVSEILPAGERISTDCRVESSPQKQIITIHQGGRIREFQITSTEGSWENVRSAGSSRYEVSFDGANGTITFLKDDVGTTVLVDFSQNPAGITRKIFIDRIVFL